MICCPLSFPLSLQSVRSAPGRRSIWYHPQQDYSQGAPFFRTRPGHHLVAGGKTIISHFLVLYQWAVHIICVTVRDLITNNLFVLCNLPFCGFVLCLCCRDIFNTLCFFTATTAMCVKSAALVTDSPWPIFWLGWQFLPTASSLCYESNHHSKNALFEIADQLTYTFMHLVWYAFWVHTFPRESKPWL